MLDLLLAASMLLPMDGTACDLYEAWEPDAVESCIVTEAAVEAGGVTLAGGQFTMDDWAWSDEETLGFLVYDPVDIVDEDGNYTMGGWPVCVNDDGTVYQAGAGSSQQWFPGATWTENRLSIALAFNLDPCLPPLERGVVVWNGYTPDSPQGDSLTAGWVNGRNWEVDPYDAWKGTTTATILSEPTLNAGTGVWSGGWSVSLDFDGDTKGWRGSRQIRAHCGDGLIKTAMVWDIVDGAPHTFTIACGSGTTVPRFQFFAENWNGWAEYFPVGVEDRYEPPAAGGYATEAMLVKDGRLGDIPYAPIASGFVYADGVCDTAECVTSYCDDVDTLDVVGYFRCLFAIDASFSDVWNSMIDSIHGWQLWAVVDYGVSIFQSFGHSFTAQDGMCGQLIEPSDELEGLTLNSCELPQQSMIRTLLGAVFWIAVGATLVGWVLRFVTDQKAPVPALGPSTTGDYEWGSIS